MKVPRGPVESSLLWRSVRVLLLEELFLMPPVMCDCRRLRRFSCWSLPSPSAGCLTTSSPCGWSLAPSRLTTRPSPSASSLTVCRTGTPASTPSSTPSSPRTSDRRVGRSSPAAFCVRRRQTTRLFAFGQRTCPVRIPPPTCKGMSVNWSPYGCHWVKAGTEAIICPTHLCILDRSHAHSQTLFLHQAIHSGQLY